MRTRTLLAALLRPAVLFAACVGCGKSPPTDHGDAGNAIDVPAAKLNAQGATFVEPIMTYWTEEFGRKTGGKVQINYQGTGSGAGVRALVNKEAAFGCSDAPLTRKQLEDAKKAGGDVVHVPTVIGAVVPMYNLPGVEPPVKFTGPLLAKIFTGKVKKWNDPALKELNPGMTLPDLSIMPVYRADESGTSFIFTDYLAGIDPEFKSTVGASKKPNWPQDVGVGKPQSAGVAGHITANPGSIGYIELTYALDTKAKFGSVRNAAGKDVVADFDGIAAAADASLSVKQTQEPYSLHELTYNLSNAPGEKSYPIAAMSFAIIFKKQAGAEGKATVEFLKWVTTPEGQSLAQKRQFAPLPPALQQTIHAALGAVELR